MSGVEILRFHKVVKVENENGRAHLHPKCSECGPWLDHWQNHTGKTSFFCTVEGCTNLSEVGAHVYLPDDKRAFIVPMCKSHNGAKGPLPIFAGTEFVHASQQACAEANK
ncbi:hypothetical protein [Aeromonas veronii]|uniref:hypothetical protein n=1 Tax=Aeromonas veronii TaxID=654 RepID=UPI0021E81409|nr:hypothetical protein [Aeromonas veronii]MCV3283424.1 hypothetical protein [Aeromonas veronii]